MVYDEFKVPIRHLNGHQISLWCQKGRWKTDSYQHTGTQWSYESDDIAQEAYAEWEELEPWGTTIFKDQVEEHELALEI